MSTNTYRVDKTIMLSFIVDNEQGDYLIDRGMIEFDGKAIWRRGKDGYLRESITQNHAIEVWLAEGRIVPVTFCTLRAPMKGMKRPNGETVTVECEADAVRFNPSRCEDHKDRLEEAVDMTPVIINGHKMLIEESELSYERIVELADSGRSKEALHTVVYRVKFGEWERTGTLYPGSPPLGLDPAASSTVISAMVTDNA